MIVQYNYKTERDLCKKKKNLEQKFEKKNCERKILSFGKKFWTKEFLQQKFIIEWIVVYKKYNEKRFAINFCIDNLIFYQL